MQDVQADVQGDNVVKLFAVMEDIRSTPEVTPKFGIKYLPTCVDIGKLNWYAIQLAEPYRKRGVPLSAFPEAYLTEVRKMVNELVHGLILLDINQETGLVFFGTKDDWDDTYTYSFKLKLAHLHAEP